MPSIKHFFEDFKDKPPNEKLLMVGGTLSLAAAVVGIFLPVIPQVPFAILAAFLFSKGHPGVHRWIRGNKHLGPPVKDWEDHQVVRPKLKVFSTLAMIGGGAMGHWKLPLGWAIALDVVFLACIIFVLTRKSKP